MSIQTTIDAIQSAESWAQRIQQIRLVPQRHGTGEHGAVFSAIARVLYLPHLAPDFAYIHDSPFYDEDHFSQAYDEADRLTAGFTRVSEDELILYITDSPCILLVFRTLLGLTKDEFSHSTILVAEENDTARLSSSQIDTMERETVRNGKRLKGAQAVVKAAAQAKIAAKTIAAVMEGRLFGDAPAGLHTKQKKPDTRHGWLSVRDYAKHGVPLSVFLHQRHYGGAFRQVLDATSTLRGALIEDAVEALFVESKISFIRTGSHNQAEIAEKFEVHVTPAPDFVVFDPIDGSLKAILECKGTNNGGTARDKALRFGRLRAESVRLGGVPLIAVLGGIGWARINDALGPVVKDTDGRVFTLSTLHSMLEVAPFPGLIGAI